MASDEKPDAQAAEKRPARAAGTPSVPPAEPVDVNLPASPGDPLEDQAAAQNEQPRPVDAGDGEQPAPERYRLLPADWTVDKVEFPGTDADGEDVTHVVTANTPFNTPFVVAADEADDLIAEAARHGFAIVKEPVA